MYQLLENYLYLVPCQAIGWVPEVCTAADGALQGPGGGHSLVALHGHACSMQLRWRFSATIIYVIVLLPLMRLELSR